MDDTEWYNAWSSSPYKTSSHGNGLHGAMLIAQIHPFFILYGEFQYSLRGNHSIFTKGILLFALREFKYFLWSNFSIPFGGILVFPLKEILVIPKSGIGNPNISSREIRVFPRGNNSILTEGILVFPLKEFKYVFGGNRNILPEGISVFPLGEPQWSWENLSIPFGGILVSPWEIPVFPWEIPGWYRGIICSRTENTGGKIFTWGKFCAQKIQDDIQRMFSPCKNCLIL